MDSSQSGRASRAAILQFVGYGLSILCLVWVLHDFHIVRALHEMAQVSWKWVLLGMAFDVLSYGIQALRWKILLTPFGKVKLSRTIRAVYAGLFANLVFPLRPGEFLRSYLITNSEGITLGRTIGSVGVERLVDLVIATASLAVASLFVDLPRRFRRVADTLGIVMLVLIGAVVAVIFFLEKRLGAEPAAELQCAEKQRFPERVMTALVGLHTMGTAPSFYPAVLVSALMPLSQVVALWAMMRSYDLKLPFLAAVVVVLVINLGVSLPNAPANVGSYQFFCVLGLQVFQTEKTRATGFSIFAFIALTIPFVFLGFAALLRSGLSLRTMRDKVTHIPERP